MAGQLNALGLPVHLDEQAELEEELGGIASRLQRALTRFDDENEEQERELEADERAAFQSRYVSMTGRMDAMARERNELLSSLAQWLENAESELEEPTSRPTSRASPKPSEEPEHGAMFDRVVTTRMGVQKLKKLNENMVQQAVQGRDMEYLAKEEEQLQKKVVEKFKELIDNRKRNVIGKTFGAHWKHASAEIVALLSRIRKEGVSGIDELEAQLQRASRAIQRQADEMQRLEQKVYEKDQEIEQIANENSKLTNDNLLLTSEKEKYRDQIMKYRKALRKQRQEEKKTLQEPEAEFSDDEEEELKRLVTPATPIASPYQTKQRRSYNRRQKKTSSTGKKTAPSTTPAAREQTMSVEERPPSPDRAGASEFDEMRHLEEENFDMKEKMLLLEKKVIEKEHKMLSLEHQINELIESIKNITPELLSKLNDDLNVRGPSVQDIASAIQNAVEEVIEEGKMASKVSIKETSDRKNKEEANIPKPTKRPSLPSDASSPSPRDTSSSEPSPAASPSLVQQHAKPYVDPEVVQTLREEKETLQQELKNAKSELRRAQWELISLRHDNSQRGVVPSFPASRDIPPKLQTTAETDAVTNGKEMTSPSMLRMLLESHRREEISEETDENRTAKALANLRTQDYLPSDKTQEATVEYDDEFQAYADLVRAERWKFTRRLLTRPKPVGLVRSDGRGSRDSTTPVASEFEEYAVEDQGMQTDPTMDPLGAWSNVPLIQPKDKMNGVKKSIAEDKPVLPKAGLLPPKEWVLFDPTTFQDMPKDRLSLGDIFEKKVAPKDIDSTSDLINFVEGELSRLSQGISGYTSYLNKLIEEQVTSMSNANQSMRRKLSDATLKRMDKMRAQSMQKGKGSGRKSVADKTRDKGTTTIRRGRFEMVKPGEKSQYTTKRAFGSYYAGQRFVIQQGAIPEQLQTKQLKSSGGQPYPWETYARDHIHKAEMEAVERNEPQTLAASRDPCEILKLQVDQIAQHAIDVLRGTTTFFKEALKDQLEEYDTLQEVIQIKEDLEAVAKPSGKPTTQASQSAKDEGQCDTTQPPAVKISRSTSHGSFLGKRRTELDGYDKLPGPAGPAATPMNELFLPSQSHSFSSIQSSHRYLPPLLLYKEGEPRNRDQYKLPKATLPKKGMVTLAVSDMSSKTSQDDKNKPYDPRKRHRPAPQTHDKLQSKQRGLLQKTNEEAADDVVEGITLYNLRSQLLELPVGFYRNTSQREDVSTLSIEKSAERRQLILNAEEQVRDGSANLDKYTAIFSQTY